MSVRVSIVVPVYNGERTIAATLRSLLAQSLPAFEVLAVDDGSTDRSSAVIEPFLSDKRVTYLQKTNGGVAAARNYGVTHARGDLIAFCDHDDFWLPSKLSLQVPLFANERVGLVYSWSVEVVRCSDGSLQEVKRPRRGHPRYRGDCIAWMYSGNFMSSCTVVLRKSVIEQAGMFDEDRNLSGVDDWHLWLRVALITEFDLVPSVLAQHLVHDGNYSHRERDMLQAERLCLKKVTPVALGHGISKRQLRILESQTLRHYAENLFYIQDYRASAECYWQAWCARPLGLDCLVYAGVQFLVPRAVITAVRSFARLLKVGS